MNGPDRMRRIETLVETLETEADPATRRAARELVALLLEHHREALDALVALAGDREALLARCDGDPGLASALLLHDLHPRSADERAGKALDALRPELAAAGWDAVLAPITGGQLRVRLVAREGARAGGALARRIEGALVDAVPEAEECIVEGAGAPDLVPLRIPARPAT